MTGAHPPDNGTEDAGSPRVALPPVARRHFLTFATATGALVYAGDLFTALAARAAPDDIAAPPFVRSVRRREDFLALTFEFHNLKLDNSTPRKLVKTNKNKPAFLGVVLPPQHLADETFEVDADLPSPGEVRTRLAAPTRLAFEVPATVLPLAFNLETLLDWSDLPQRVVPLAQPNVANPELRAPHPDETAIELPWALVLSPTSEAGWSHATVPVTHDDRTELWHSRLGNREVGGISAGGRITYPLLAVWARKPLPAPDNAVFPLHDTDRANIVRQTTDRSLGSRRQPLRAERLMLSSLGGWLEGRAAWDGLPLAEWTQRTAMGRDTYVKVVTRGHLFPFGHKAVYTRITERRFEEIAGGYKGAYLITRDFVTVLDPVRAYGVPGHPDGGRRFPYRSVRITTLTTPDLSPAAPATGPFVPKVGGAPFLFDLIGTDWAGQDTELTAPLIFVTLGTKVETIHALVNAYNAAAPDDPETSRKRPTNGQKVAFAPETKRGDTSFDVSHLLLGAQRALSQFENALSLAEEAPFFPDLIQAGVRLPAAEQLAGKLLGEALVGIDPAFVLGGFDAGNPGEVFLRVLDDGLGQLGFGGGADRSGGIATPDLSVAGLSRLLGPVGGALDKVRAGTFDPKDYFDEAAKLLGSLKLFDVIKKLDGPHGLKSGPTIQTILEPEPPALPKRIVTKLDWKPTLQPDPAQIFLPKGDSSLTLNAKIVTDLVTPADSTFEIKGDLRNFDLQLLGSTKFIVISVEKVAFTSAKDTKPDLDVVLGEVHFDGPLKFVDEFRNFLSSLGPGFAIDVTAKGIDASLTLPLPTIAVGVFSLQNISIVLGAIVPFTDDAARFHFGFCSRENPFKLTIAMFGGGGFFAFECGTDHSIMLEVSLEFGASVAFDIGVASGGVEVMAGIYIKVENSDALLAGFLRMGGHLSILGIISISCELYLGFEYYSEPDKCIGRARFFLEIEVFIFSITIEAEVERRFGGEDDPTFAQMMSPVDWTEYCNAYAAIGAP